ncbi:sodium:proton antiporter [Streptococcus minor]|uniref:Sodium:proton antiporter n=1 Tax=Streptococcus minor TaxID=229549 RepID=A0A3P1VE20_9STRE|nr:cation:proton antiporter [Streptococcus minor]RRD32411.1 sodium:proton antiporter [Streptococcus minor]
MLTSLAYVFLGGLLLALLSERIGLPRIIGMLLAGVVLGPFMLNLLDASLLEHSTSWRQMALVIILIKAGLTINLKDLKQVGRPALLMSFLPASFELLAYIFLAPLLFGMSTIDAALLGSVMAAVSPAVVVPRMVYLIDKGYGIKKSIPQLILAGASLDDIVVIVLFTSFLSMASGGSLNLFQFLNIPLSIVLGVLLGAFIGFVAIHFFKQVPTLHLAQKMIILLGLAFMLLALESWLKGRIALSGLLAVMSMAAVIKIKSPKEDTMLLADSFGTIWIAAELLLFVLVGTAVDIRYLGNAGLPAVLMILPALVIRSLGVLISISGSHLNKKEKLFVVLAYLPKATVQAAIGTIPLATGLESGKMILSVAVIGIVLTAPLGALLMDTNYATLLTKDN